MAAPPPVLTVAVEKGPRQGETRHCRAGAALRVGRVVKGNDLAVRDGGASQKHLVIEFLPPPGAGWAVSDLGTSNGTLLNGAPLAPSVPAPLSHGDLIKVGDSTVLAVSMASDSDPNPVADPGQRRTSRHAAAAVEEKPPVMTRRGTRNKTAAEAPEAEKAEPNAAAVVVEEKPPAVTLRGTRSKAPPVAEPPEVEKEEPDAAAVVVEEKPQVARRRGGRKKLAPGQMDETAEAPRQGEQKKALEPSCPENKDEEKEEPMVLLCHGSPKSVTEPAEPKEEEKAPVATRRGGRKKNVATIAPPPLPPKAKSARGRGTRANSSTAVLQEEQGGNELAASRAQTANLLSPTAVKGDGEQRGVKVAVGDGGVEVELEDTVKASKEEMPKGMANSHSAASNNAANAAAGESTGEMEEAAEVIRHRRRKKVVEHHEPEKDSEETTVVTHRGGRKEVAEQSEPGRDEETTLVTRRGRGGRKKVVEQPETKNNVEETTVATRRGGRKKAADQLEPEKDVEEITVVRRCGRQKKVVEQPELVKEDAEEEGAMALTRRGRRKKNALLVAPPSPELVKEDDEKEEGALELTRRGGRKKNALLVAPPSLPPKMSSTRGGGRITRASVTVKAVEEELPKGRARAKLAVSNTVAHVAAAEIIVEMKETSEAPRRGRQKKAVEPAEPEKEDAIGVTRRKGQKKAAVVTCHAGSKKDSAVVAPPLLPPKTGSGRGHRRVTRTNARNNVLQEDAKAEQEEDEVTVPREQAGNLQIAMTVNGGEDREVKGATRALEDDAPEGRDSAQHASSENGGKEDQGGAHCSSRVHSGSSGIPNTTSKYREDRKLKAYSTPFDVRLDRALKKYST